MSLTIKICGLSTIDTLGAALDAGADMVGLVFFPPSPRHLDIDVAARLADHARGRAEIVALSVNADDAYLNDIVSAVNPDRLQLHGSEPPERVTQLKAMFGIQAMKAIGISTAKDLDKVNAYKNVADHLLFDAKPPKDATRPGGLGQPFDWHLLERVDRNLPYMLSGGLDLDNIAEALAITHAKAIDISSGVESKRGVKDVAKIRAFIECARAAAQHISGVPESV